LNEFLSNFDGLKNRGVITSDEFFDFYTDISMNLPADEYFVHLLESTWQVHEDDNDPYLKSTV